MKGKSMKTAINGKVRMKWFWGCTYSGRGMTPIERLFKIGRLILAKVVYVSGSAFRPDFYKASALKEIEQWYEVRWENIPGGDDTDEMWYAVYSRIDSGYVGTPEDAYRLMQQGIVDVQKSEPKDNVCSIGLNPNTKKWYGWSHRAMHGFGVGDVVKEGDCCASSGYTEEYLHEHPDEDESLPVGFRAENMADAKRMAIAFADSVS